MQNNTFNSKETYLAWRKQWAQEYRTLCKLIRSTKNDIKNQHRAKGHAEYHTWTILLRARRSFSNHMDLLVPAKIEAQRQYLAQKQLEAENGKLMIASSGIPVLNL